MAFNPGCAGSAFGVRRRLPFTAALLCPSALAASSSCAAPQALVFVDRARARGLGTTRRRPVLARASQPADGAPADAASLHESTQPLSARAGGPIYSSQTAAAPGACGCCYTGATSEGGPHEWDLGGGRPHSMNELAAARCSMWRWAAADPADLPLAAGELLRHARSRGLVPNPDLGLNLLYDDARCWSGFVRLGGTGAVCESSISLDGVGDGVCGGARLRWVRPRRPGAYWRYGQHARTSASTAC